MTDMTEGTVYNYAIKVIVTGESLDLEPKTLPFTWKQGGEIAAAKIEYTAVPTAASCDFKYTIELGEDINTDDIESVLVALLTGDEVFNEDAKYHAIEVGAFERTSSTSGRGGYAKPYPPLQHAFMLPHSTSRSRLGVTTSRRVLTLHTTHIGNPDTHTIHS